MFGLTDLNAAIRLPLTALLLLLALACAERMAQSSEPVTLAILYDLNADAAPLLRQFPNVVEVERHGPTKKPTHRIIHVADWHFVPKAAYAADLRSQSIKPINNDEIDRRHTELLDQVELVQQQQIELLRTLVKQHGLKKVYVEGLASRDRFIFKAKVSALRKASKEVEGLRREKEEFISIGDPDDETKAIIHQIEEVEAQHRSDLLHLGAAGRLMLSREIEGVLSLEDADAYAASNPVSHDGAVVLDKRTMEAREDAQARLLLDSGPVAVVILGGAHDLSDNLERIAPGKAKYIRVEVKAWKEVTSN